MELFPLNIYYQVPGYATNYLIGTPVTNYPDTATLTMGKVSHHTDEGNQCFCSLPTTENYVTEDT